MKSSHSASVVKQVHVRPSLIKVDSDQPSNSKIEDHENFAHDLNSIPNTLRMTFDPDEEKAGKEIVGLNQKEEVRPQIGECRVVCAFPKVDNLVDGGAPNWVNNLLEHDDVVILLCELLPLVDFSANS